MTTDEKLYLMERLLWGRFRAAEDRVAAIYRIGDASMSEALAAKSTALHTWLAFAERHKLISW